MTSLCARLYGQSSAAHRAARAIEAVTVDVVDGRGPSVGGESVELSALGLPRGSELGRRPAPANKASCAPTGPLRVRQTYRVTLRLSGRFVSRGFVGVEARTDPVVTTASINWPPTQNAAAGMWTKSTSDQMSSPITSSSWGSPDRRCLRKETPRAQLSPTGPTRPAGAARRCIWPRSRARSTCSTASSRGSRTSFSLATWTAKSESIASARSASCALHLGDACRLDTGPGKKQAETSGAIPGSRGRPRSGPAGHRAAYLATAPGARQYDPGRAAHCLAGCDGLAARHQGRGCPGRRSTRISPTISCHVRTGCVPYAS